MAQHRIADEPVPLIFRDILGKKMSGELVVLSDQAEKKLLFSQGYLKYGQSNMIHDRLGEILFKLGKINQTQFWNIQKLLQSENEKIGKILVKKNILTQKDIFFALLYQIRTIAISVFGFHSGTWEFTEKNPQVPQDINFNIELAALISEGIQKISNFSYYSDKFRNLSPVPAGRPQSGEILSAENQKFFRQLGDYHHIPCAQLVSRFQLPEELFWRKILLLHLLNMLDFQKTSGPPPSDKTVDELLLYHDKIKSAKLDYYQLFEVEPTAGVEEIKESYFSLAKKFHPDRIPQEADSDLKEKANFVFATFNKAFETLSNETKRKEYDNRGDKRTSDDTPGQENPKEKARIYYLKARTLFNKKQYWEAAAILDEAVKADSAKAPYLLLLGLCQIQIDSLRRMAEKNLQKAAELEPWNAEPLVALGTLFQSEGLTNRAKTFFNRALAINPEHPVARKYSKGTDSKHHKKISLGSFFGKNKK